MRLSKRIASLERSVVTNENKVLLSIQEKFRLPLPIGAPPHVFAEGLAKMQELQTRLRATGDDEEQQSLCMAFRVWIDGVHAQYGGK